jgi:hypothetical protein
MTPHNAAGGTGRYVRQAELFAANLDRYLAGHPLENDITDMVLASGRPIHGAEVFPH